MAEMLSIDDRMKLYEAIESNRKTLPFLPVLARLDGRSFHKWTKGLKAPFDSGLRDLFYETTKWIMEKTDASVAYTQSDEVSLCWYNPEINSQMIFNGRYQKLSSVLASMFTYQFNKNISKFVPSKTDHPAFFDCRIWQVPNISEATNVFVWRFLDAKRNAVQMIGRNNFSHKELNKKNCTEIEQMLKSVKNIDISSFDDKHMFGVFISRKQNTGELTSREYITSTYSDFHKKEDKIGILFGSQFF